MNKDLAKEYIHTQIRNHELQKQLDKINEALNKDCCTGAQE